MNYDQFITNYFNVILDVTSISHPNPIIARNFSYYVREFFGMMVPRTTVYINSPNLILHAFRVESGDHINALNILISSFKYDYKIENGYHIFIFK